MRSAPTPRPTPSPRRVPARGVIVAGRDDDGTVSAEAVRCAERLRFPLLADALSPARADAHAIATYDLLLRDPAFGSRMAPEIVLRVGDLPTSKPLRAWLAGLDTHQLSLEPWQDPDAVVGELLGGVAALAGLELDGSADDGWLTAWRDADALVVATLEQRLEHALSEPLVARRLGEWLGADADLFVASSMPIRDVELYLPAGRPLPRVLANRGANGIDGTVSSAFGVAAASGRRIVLLIGDVALAHDIGGLLAARRLGLELTIVLLNNDGGGIFHFLPVSGEGEAFEHHVATPHGLDFAHAAALYGLAYEHVQTEPELRAALERGGSQLIEVRTDRVANLALHRRLADAGLAALRAVSPSTPAASLQA